MMHSSGKILVGNGLQKKLKYFFLFFLFLLALIYASPNFFGDDPSLQISTEQIDFSQAIKNKVNVAFKDANIKVKSFSQEKPREILIRFFDTDSQLKAKDLLHQIFPQNYIIALHLAPAVPEWLTAIGAHPMPLGLDLRGGVHLTLDVDAQAVVLRNLDADYRSIIKILREKNISYNNAWVDRKEQNIQLQLNSTKNFTVIENLLNKNFPQYEVLRAKSPNTLYIHFTPSAIHTITSEIVEQTMSTLRNRVNELGVSEAVVQQKGGSRISVDLPGIQDSAHAKEILGGTATIDFRMVDEENEASRTEVVPFGSQLYQYENHPILLKKQVILHGKSISGAHAGYSDNGRPSVTIELGNSESQFYQETRREVGHLLATVFIENKTQTKFVNNHEIKVRTKTEKVINVARIREALGKNFQVTGLASDQEARNLALLLRAGALPANIEIIEERVVGPTLGLENIHRGMISLIVGLVAIIVFMAFYYHGFGLIANVALGLNLIFLVALLSILGATLTFPGIAGIVLTLGMAVDANVLIFERIREELRNHVSPYGSIKAGFERAFSTIVDANITTFIVAFLLFSIGEGAVKGFAVTLSLGLLTSMLTAVTYSRAISDIIYERKNIKKLSIGM